MGSQRSGLRGGQLDLWMAGDGSSIGRCLSAGADCRIEKLPERVGEIEVEPLRRGELDAGTELHRHALWIQVVPISHPVRIEPPRVELRYDHTIVQPDREKGVVQQNSLVDEKIIRHIVHCGILPFVVEFHVVVKTIL